MLTVFIRDLLCDARIGIYDHEKTAPQKLRVQIEVVLKLLPAADDIDATLDYDGLRAIALRHAAQHHDLLESLAQKIAADILTDKRVASVAITLEKPQAHADCVVGVRYQRSYNDR